MMKKIARTTSHQLFSTKSFVPGHVVGAAALLFGTIALTKAVIARHEAEVRAQLAPGSAGRGVLAENERGQYGGKP